MSFWVINGWDSDFGTWDVRGFKNLGNARVAYYKQIVEIQQIINNNDGDGSISDEDYYCNYNIGSTKGYFCVDRIDIEDEDADK